MPPSIASSLIPQTPSTRKSGHQVLLGCGYSEESENKGKKQSTEAAGESKCGEAAAAAVADMGVNVSSSATALLCFALVVVLYFQEVESAAAATTSAAARSVSKKPAPRSACSAANLVITQSKTGNVVEGKPEYEVTVVNRCRCSQSRVTTRCYGLSSVRPVDPRAIKPVDDELCVVNRGRPVVGGGRVRFRYAWMTPQDFPVVSSQIQC